MSSMFTTSSYGRGQQTWEDLTRAVDTGWVQVPITNTTNFSPYGGVPTSVPRVRKIGNQVWFEGALNVLVAGIVENTTTDAPNQFITDMPEDFRPPPELTEPVFVCQGSSTNRWALRVYTSGVCVAHRYGPATSVVGSWLPFHVTWLVD